MAKRNNDEIDFDLKPEFILREMMNITLQELKLGHDPWRKLSHDKQDQIIARVANGCKDLLRRVLALVSSEGFTRVQVTLDQVVIKDGIKGQISLTKSDANWPALCAAQSHLCTLVLVNAEQFTDAPHGFLADFDQMILPLPDAQPDGLTAANDQDAIDQAKADAIAATLEPVAPEPVTREQIDALHEEIQRARREALEEGITEDPPEILALVAERDALIERLNEQERAAVVLTPAQETAAAIQALDARIAAALANPAIDDPEPTAIANEMYAERARLVATLEAQQQAEVTAAAAELDRNARESGNVVVLADGDGTVLAEFGKAA